MTAIINELGQILQIIHANEETVQLNTPEGCRAVEDPPHLNMYYKDGWIELPEQPSSFHIFDYEKHDWIDNRTLSHVKDQKWKEIKNLRDSIEYGGFNYNGHVYDSDIQSQTRITVASNSNQEVEWTTQNDEVVLLTTEQFQELVSAMTGHISECHERGRIARQKVNEAMTIEEVEAVVF